MALVIPEFQDIHSDTRDVAREETYNENRSHCQDELHGSFDFALCVHCLTLQLPRYAGCAVDNNAGGHKELEYVEYVVPVEPWIIPKADVEALTLRVVV